jgi:hypothetical protein
VTDDEISGSMHDELIIYPTRSGARTVHVRALAGRMAFTPAEARKLAADLLNRADAIDPPVTADAVSA